MRRHAPDLMSYAVALDDLRTEALIVGPVRTGVGPSMPSSITSPAFSHTGGGDPCRPRVVFRC